MFTWTPEKSRTFGLEGRMQENKRLTRNVNMVRQRQQQQMTSPSAEQIVC